MELGKRSNSVSRRMSPSVNAEHTGAFVVQKHDASRLHYDFRLGIDGVLKSWAVPKGPSLDPAEKRLAVEVEDHPMEYGSFEGVIPQGQYGGGPVLLWDRGRYVMASDPGEGFRKGVLKFDLKGEKLRGSWNLVRIGGPRSKNWLLIKHRDDAATSGDDAEIAESQPQSVVSGRTIEDMTENEKTAAKKAPHRRTSSSEAVGRPAARLRKDPVFAGVKSVKGAIRAAMPEYAEAELATLTSSAPGTSDWIHEIKFDGYRILGFIEDKHVRLVSRNGRDWTDKFPDVAQAMATLSVQNAILDGEIVAMTSDGRSSFEALQNSLSGSGDVVYYAFDLLYINGYDIREAHLLARKELLAAVVPPESKSIIRYSKYFGSPGESVLKRACALKLEGIISKKKDSAYVSGRTKSWLKIKCVMMQEFVIGGFTDPTGSRKGFGALALGVYDSEGLRYCGTVGAGFSTRALEELHAKLRGIETRTCPFVNAPKDARTRSTHWVKPELVGEVQFTEWTNDGRLRHPSFKGMRLDKDPREVRAEIPE